MCSFQYILHTRIGVHMIQAKRVSTCIYGTMYVWQIYEKSTVQLASVGLTQAGPNYICTLHCTLPVVFCTAFTAVLYIESYLFVVISMKLPVELEFQLLYIGDGTKMQSILVS